MRLQTHESLATPRRRFSTLTFNRYVRLLHGWLSAFAFLILCFFSITGLLLNHPDWSAGTAPESREQQFTLNEHELEQLGNADEPERLLTQIVARKVSLKGEFTGGNEVGNELFVRLQGVRGLSDIRANLVTGTVKTIVEPAPAVSILNELHRGERAGKSWRLLIDAVAILLIVMSIVGYLIFLSLKFRIRTALLLTGISAIGVWSVFAVAVA